MISTIPVILTSKQKTFSRKADTLGTSLSLHMYILSFYYTFSVLKLKNPVVTNFWYEALGKYLFNMAFHRVYLFSGQRIRESLF